MCLKTRNEDKLKLLIFNTYAWKRTIKISRIIGNLEDVSEISTNHISQAI